MYEGPAVAFTPQGPEGPWSGPDYTAELVLQPGSDSTISAGPGRLVVSNQLKYFC